MIVDADRQGFRGGDDLIGHFDVGARRRRISRGVIVDEQTSAKIAHKDQYLTKKSAAAGVCVWELFRVPSRDRFLSVIADDGRKQTITH
jgi:hypothetical protein